MIKADKKGGLHMAKTSQPKGIYEYGSLTIDQPRHEVSIRGNLIELEQRDFDILCLLISHPNEALPCDYFHNVLWPQPDPEHGEQEVTSCIQRLQEKLKLEQQNLPCQIKCVDTPRGKGYCFSVESNI